MSRVSGFAAFIVVIVVSSTASGDVISVPQDYPAIQDAIDAAKDYDSIVVDQGVYKENINFLGKILHVKSRLGPAVTVIDGNQAGSTVTFNHAEPQDAVLEGFTVTNGSGTGPLYDERGGGVFCNGGSPTIIRNVIEENSCNAEGGGVFCMGGSAMIVENTVTLNVSGPGGGIACINSSAVISSNYVFKNTGYVDGGGIYGKYSSLLVVNNIIAKNLAWGDLFGGGPNPPPHVDVYGGGIYMVSCSNTHILNDTVYANAVDGWYDLYGAGIYVTGGGVQVTNSIVYKNYGKDAGQIKGCSVTYSDVQNGYTGTGNIDADPVMVHPNHNDYHLLYASPCRNAGDNLASGLPDEDFEGDPRIADGTVDMGADEFHGHLYYKGLVKPGGFADVKIVGQPLTSPVILGVSTGLYDPPLQTQYGPWYLKLPLSAMIGLGAMPAGGILVLHYDIPPDFPTPAAVPLQVLLGDKATNHVVFEVW